MLELMSAKQKRRLDQKEIIVIAGIIILVSIDGYALGRRSNNQPTPAFDRVIADWKTYAMSKGLYSFRYPPDWHVSEEKQNGYTIPVVILRPNTAPCPSSINPFTCQTAQEISIAIDNNANNASLTDFLNQRFGQFKPTYTPLAISGLEGLRTSGIPGEFEQENVFVKNHATIYRIAWIKGQATKQITEAMFNQILSTFKLTN